MQSLNKIFLMGYIGNDPKLFTTKNGKLYTGLSVATNRRILAGEEDEDGQQKKVEATDWHYVRAWGKQAETCSKYLTRGAPVHIEGYVTQYIKNKEGAEPERITGINAVHVNFLPRAIQQSELN